jgi:nucleotide-binding universal stress UspA family protein
MKTILYTINCSKKTSMALKYAYELRASLGAKLHVLHVYDLYPIITSTVRSRGVLEKNYYNEQYILLQRYCKKILNHKFWETKIKYHVEKSDTISETILNTANKINADLVLIGAKNPSVLRGLFTSNIANDVMGKLECPLLILPDEFNYHGFSTLLYATDFEETDIHAIEQLVEFAEPYGAKIKIIHIPRKKEVDLELKMKWFKQIVSKQINYPEISFSSKQSEDVESGIQDYIKKDMPEMLVMMERQKETFIKRVLHKDMVKNMEDEVSIPLLVFNKRRYKLDFQKSLMRHSLCFVNAI